jgi:DNA-binding YbaB/EbfC family protein
MFKGISNLASILQNASELNGKLQSLTNELKSKRVTGSAGGGMVEVEVNGLCEVLRVKIDPLLVERGEREMLESLLPGAINQAFSKAKELHVELAKSATKDLPLPGFEDVLSKLMGK